ncbi:MAG: sigma-54-dependent transcriptional regulator [Planctomycetota bacterium]|jgi:DNA-binding NtrC family response regulator
MRRILFLDTPAGDLAAFFRTFREAAGDGGTLTSLTDAEEVCAEVRDRSGVDLVVVDWFVGDGTRSGEQVIAQVHALDPELPVVAVAEKGDVETAFRAVQAGACDFLVRGPGLPQRVSTLLGKVQRLIGLLDRNRLLDERYERLREAYRERYRIVGRSPQFDELIEKIRRVAGIPRPVLIVGERGTGKELVARAVHSESGAPERPIVTVNCAAFTDALLESELFGHERGAFTGAEKTTRGKFELARHGTLFLDEIGNMSLSFQQKILRVVEYGTFTRVGGGEEIHTDARIIAATNADLTDRIREGLFLQDLYDRLAFEVIRVPPLRERHEDIEALAHHFLEQFAAEIPAFRGKLLSARAVAALRRYPFPGNVRELKNLIERAAYRDTTNEITPEDIDLPAPETREPGTGGFTERVESYKRRLILETLADADGNQAEAARRLGMTYHQFRHQYRKYAGRS